jgi:hypothetical protein
VAGARDNDVDSQSHKLGGELGKQLISSLSEAPLRHEVFRDGHVQKELAPG